MAQIIGIPPYFQQFTNGATIIEVNAQNVGKAMEELEAKFPELKQQLRDRDGTPRRFVNWYVNEEDIRFLQHFQTPLKDGDRLWIVPPIIDASSAFSAVRVAEDLTRKNGRGGEI